LPSSSEQNTKSLLFPQMCKSCGKTIPLLRSFLVRESYSQRNNSLAPRFRSRPTFVPRPPYCLLMSAGDSRRLTRRGQEKNVEERVPVFTQHTQFFHKRKIRECKHFPSRKCNESWGKNRKPITIGETFPKHLPAFRRIHAVEKPVTIRKVLHNGFLVDLPEPTWYRDARIRKRQWDRSR